MNRKKKLARIVRYCLRIHSFARDLESQMLMRSIELTLACAESAPTPAAPATPRKA